MPKSVHKKRQSGGQYSSASSYGMYVNGNVDDQYSRVFSQTGPYSGIPGNLSIGAQGQNAGVPPSVTTSLSQKAGKRRSMMKRAGMKKSKSMKKIGGMKKSKSMKKNGGMKKSRSMKKTRSMKKH